MGRKGYSLLTGMHGFLSTALLMIIGGGIVGLLIKSWWRLVPWGISLVSLWMLLSRLYLRIRTPWTRHHYPLMTIFSAAQGAAAAMHGSTNYQFEDVAPIFLGMAFPDMAKDSIKEFVSSSKELLDDKTVRNDIFDAISKVNPQLDRAGFDSLMERWISEQPDVVKLYFLLANIAGHCVAPNIKGKYIAAALTGKIS